MPQIDLFHYSLVEFLLYYNIILFLVIINLFLFPMFFIYFKVFFLIKIFSTVRLSYIYFFFKFNYSYNLTDFYYQPTILSTLNPALVKKQKPLTKSHNFHIVGPHISPILISLSLTILLYIFVQIMNNSWHICLFKKVVCLIIPLGIFFYGIIWWVLSLFYESSSYLIYNTTVSTNLLSGMTLFILSEVMLFFAFFWAFFHASISPSIFIGNIWPPVNLITLNPYHLPLLNTVLLLISGITLNWFYFTLKSLVYDFKNKVFPIISLEKFYSYFYTQRESICLNILFFYKVIFFYCLCLIVVNKKSIYLIVSNWLNAFLNICIAVNLILFKNFILHRFFFYIYYIAFITRKLNDMYQSLVLTLWLGISFLLYQASEYIYHATYSLNNIYGTIFYSLTGLHGAHVFIGIFLIFLVFLQFYFNLYIYSTRSHVSVTCAVWYWHFVDVVWLFLYIFLYIWGGGI